MRIRFVDDLVFIQKSLKFFHHNNHTNSNVVGNLPQKKSKECHATACKIKDTLGHLPKRLKTDTKKKIQNQQ
jgi:hypothetical protein